jgi:hypothetical protein
MWQGRAEMLAQRIRMLEAPEEPEPAPVPEPPAPQPDGRPAEIDSLTESISAPWWSRWWGWLNGA